jgi:predicted ATP-dependent protease
MLRREVASSIASDGWFQVWAANTVDEAIPLLMGISAETLHARVQQRLARFASAARHQGGR